MSIFSNLKNVDNLNNIYGKSNYCPPIMQDGRGPGTNYKPKNEYFLDLLRVTDAKSSLDLKNKLNKSHVELPKYGCDTTPEKEILPPKEFGKILVYEKNSLPKNEWKKKYFGSLI